MAHEVGIFFTKLNPDADEKSVEKALNEYGKKGWELVAVERAEGLAIKWHAVYFKRPVAR